MDKLKNFASGIKSKLTKSELEKLLNLALKSNEPPLKSVYYSIVDKTHQPEDIKLILKSLSESLSPTSKDFNKILKALLLSEALISLSSPSFLQELRQCVVKFKHFAEFNPEDKSIELIGIIRKTSQKLVYLMENSSALQEEREAALRAKERSVGIYAVVEKEQEKRVERKDGLMGAQSGGNWYESAKVHLDEGAEYLPPQFSEHEKLAFIRTVPEDHTVKPSLFSGLRTRDEVSNSKLGTNNFELKNKNFDIFKPSNSIKEETKVQERPSQPLEILPQKVQNNKSLFGVPMKPKYIKGENSEKVDRKESFEKVNQNGARADSNNLLFDLLTLEIPVKPTQEPKEKKEQVLYEVEKSGKSENSNSINLKNEMGDLCAGYNHFAFDSEFPLIINSEKKPQPKPQFSNLEQSLVNLDDLDLSLSKTMAPRRLLSTRNLIS